MPQINRIRVNNIKYNFGTQVYDDFLMRFNCKNTIYDLANGGGKSLLMLLLMQNMIPNCTLDEKQPIEKLFRNGGGNTCIHSLVEWKLDAGYIKDGFKYMTTGFCARKGRLGEDLDNNGDGAVSDLSGNSSSVSNASSASVEYFNYCIFYREFGDNDIKNLPLENNGERITYNGLKTYLRELDKTDYKYEVYVFDRKGDYQSFIAEYGIYESAWEIVRGINKTEGHVRTYFESNYKTSRKVVEDLLIEEIIQKSFNNRLSVDNDEGMMAKTLLDIKDKLVELSKKRAQISAYDSQIEEINSFKEYVGSFAGFYEQKEKLSKELYNLFIAATVMCQAKEKERVAQEELVEHMKYELAKEQEAVLVAEVMLEKKSCKAMETLVAETREHRDSKMGEVAACKKELALTESANDYRDYLEAKNSLDELNVVVENRLREDEDILREIRELANVYYQFYIKEKSGLESSLEHTKNNVDELAGKVAVAAEKLRDNEKREALEEGRRENLKEQITRKEAELRNILEKCGVLVAENTGSEIIKAEAQLEVLKEKLDNNMAEREQKKTREADLLVKTGEINARIKDLEYQLYKLDSVISDNSDEKRLEQINSVYNRDGNGNTEDIILETYRLMEAEAFEKENELRALSQFIENAGTGNYYFNDPAREKLKEYLVSQYGEDVVEGHEWFKTLNAGQKRDVLKRTPFVEYGFIIKNDFDRIKEDETLANFGRGGNVYPVISEMVLIDTKLEINKELIVFALKDMSFLRDESRRETEIKLALEEKVNLESSVDKLHDRMLLVWEDYTFVLRSLGRSILESEKASKDKLTKELEACKAEIIDIKSELKAVSDSDENLKNEIEYTQQKIEEEKEHLHNLRRTDIINDEINSCYSELKKSDMEISRLLGDVKIFEEGHREAKREYEQAVVLMEDVSRKLSQLVESWEREYSQYYTEDTSGTASMSDIIKDDADALRSRLSGLISALNDKNADVSDKQAFMAHLRSTMNKCKETIEYRGFSFEEIAEAVESSEISMGDAMKLRQIKEKLEVLQKEADSITEELASQEALFNRLEGSVAHGINQINEKYGEFKEFECDNPETFMEQHKSLIKKLDDNIRQQAKNEKSVAAMVRELEVTRKDLERIVKAAGLEIPDNIADIAADEDTDRLSAKLSEYELVAKDYTSLTKLEFKKADEFLGKRQKLIDRLMSLEADDLAEEIRISVNMPENVEKTNILMRSLEETNTFIELEKNRIHKGIEDMERIKDNFENRCIQTCSNIKTELDKLPNLSNITLDGEQISIISLGIPYVKEEMYKDRMSAYIDETVVIAESFKDADERLKYIRNRLTWKRLFSVIVTDMNAIRINLYKRERIKDQSRYLRYEEAVGSTGQSQGIYIQFLIAIINYISNLNATVHDGGVVGKTIFIDNPFGAAKDIYIWEPIFKLLETNHVQLIVPARGATPAITGRFDVNYILGQKMSQGRQQTVVVDYFSNVRETELEYTRMDYEQATFDFL
ncbi:MAG: hypothetical protein ACI4E1_09980 [Lachnospira sp.]